MDQSNDKTITTTYDITTVTAILIAVNLIFTTALVSFAFAKCWKGRKNARNPDNSRVAVAAAEESPVSATPSSYSSPHDKGSPETIIIRRAENGDDVYDDAGVTTTTTTRNSEGGAKSDSDSRQHRLRQQQHDDAVVVIF